MSIARPIRSRPTMTQRLDGPGRKEYDSGLEPQSGEVTERPIVLVSKTSVGASRPRVRIPPSPLPENRCKPGERRAFGVSGPLSRASVAAL